MMFWEAFCHLVSKRATHAEGSIAGGYYTRQLRAGGLLIGAWASHLALACCAQTGLVSSALLVFRQKIFKWQHANKVPPFPLFSLSVSCRCDRLGCCWLPLWRVANRHSVSASALMPPPFPYHIPLFVHSCAAAQRMQHACSCSPLARDPGVCVRVEACICSHEFCLWHHRRAAPAAPAAHRRPCVRCARPSARRTYWPTLWRLMTSHTPSPAGTARGICCYR